ncbi:Alpha-ribazole-5'-phosphate phosphatase [hydrothermal vent metagenome]|uniref:Alpha-ribazole-5'-phosphate phosphatase n=1 Tax=hydrothermal vent metagenome TaxID=652676 RepID=A0A3B1ADS9_9ZZZZ
MSNTVADLIRHGEPVGGRAIRGYSIDDPLNV